MDTYCAYFDTQGFRINGIFHPREVSLLSDFISINLIVDNPNCSPSKKDEYQINHLVNKFHGLDFVPRRAINEDYLGLIIKLFYEISKDGDKTIIACKSKEAQEYLDKLYINNQNIVEIYGATHKVIDRNQKPCIYHNADDTSLKCSYKIVQDMKFFIDHLNHDVPDSI